MVLCNQGRECLRDAAFNMDPELRQIPFEPVKLVVRSESGRSSVGVCELWALRTSLGALQSVPQDRAQLSRPQQRLIKLRDSNTIK